MNRPIVHFLCDANASVGFGHLSRCLKLAARLERSCAIRFSGRFSVEAKTRISQAGYSLEERTAARGDAGVAVVDIMFDKEDMDYYDRPRLSRIRRQFRRVVLLSSAITVPDDLPVDVVIGHVLPDDMTRRSVRRPFRVLGGLDYAPVSAEFSRLRGRRARTHTHIATVFLGFGASKNVRGLKRVLDALVSFGFSGEVDLLLSPFHQRFAAGLARLDTPYRLRIHSNVRSVAPLVRKADVAFGTYGNVTFEALCLGTPFVVVPVKDFQRAYAKRLERRDLLVCLDKDSQLSTTAVAAALERLTRKKRERLSRNGRNSVDGRGIERMARVIGNEAHGLRRALSRGR
jgi:spore coat polysaccharide biosynthesis predicted glycosyltransferase SpsG